jgi:hypothetical protein
MQFIQKLIISFVLLSIISCSEKSSFVDSNPAVTIEYFSKYFQTKNEIKQLEIELQKTQSNNKRFEENEENLPKMLSKYREEFNAVTEKNMVIEEHNVEANKIYTRELNKLRTQNSEKTAASEGINQKRIKEYNEQVELISEKTSKHNTLINKKNKEKLAIFQTKQEEDTTKLWAEDKAKIREHGIALVGNLNRELTKLGKSNSIEAVTIRRDLNVINNSDLYKAAFYLTLSNKNKQVKEYKVLAESNKRVAQRAKEIGILPPINWNSESFYKAISNRQKPQTLEKEHLTLPKRPELTLPSLLSLDSIVSNVKRKIALPIMPKNPYYYLDIKTIKQSIKEKGRISMDIVDESEMLGLEIDWDDAVKEVKMLVAENESMLTVTKKILIILKKHEA